MMLAVSSVAIVGMLVCNHINRVINALGVGASYESVNATSCYQVGEGALQGCEDIVVDPRTGLAYLACGNVKARQRWLSPDHIYDFGNEVKKDHLFVMDERDNYKEIKPMEMAEDGETMRPFSQDFRLHGLDIYWNPLDPTDMTFMLVNHQLNHPAISIFSYKHGEAHMIHVETLKSPLLTAPNNVVALSKRAFYATNDVPFEKGILRQMAIFLQFPISYVVHHNGHGQFSVVAKHVKYANGIAKHNDLIYVASCSDPSVHIYRQVIANNSLEFVGRQYFSNSVPDNISVDPETGQLYMANSLKILETTRYHKNPSLKTTSIAGVQISRLTPLSHKESKISKGHFSAESLLIDSGKLMPSATIAVLQKRNQTRRVLVGCVACHAVVVCPSINSI